MLDPSACLDEDTVAAFVAGRLADGDADAVDEHVDTCPSCLALIAAVAKAQPTIGDGELDDASTLLDDRALASGARVGRYVIDAFVGAGSMGVVYAAVDPDLHRRVALKLVRSRRGDDASERRARLLREAQTMAKIAHPNVAAVYDVGTFGDRVFIAMELIEGETLREWLARRPSQRDVLAAFTEAGRGLAAAHAADVVHRDFKPENVLVARDGRVVVTDFGLALGLTNQAETSQSLAGTLAYMSPEQLTGAEVDARADQFSFCVSVHEALTGERPFPGRRPAELLASIEAQAYVDPRAPAHVRRALRRGLAREPGARFPSMDALVRELERDPTAARRRFAAVGGLLCAAGALAFVIASVRGREDVRCRDGVRAKLHTVWNDTQRAAIRDAFLATKAAHASEEWTRAEQGLDAHAARWKAVHVDACDATHVRAEQSPELLDLRVACLGEQLGALRSLLDVFSHADAVVVANASKAVLGLEPLDRCSDVATLRSVASPPPDRANAVASLRADLAKAKALSDSGRVNESLTTAKAASEASVALGYAPLTAQAFLRYGEAQIDARDGDAATATLARAANLADAASDDRTRAHALIRRLFVEGYLLRHADRIQELDAAASAAITRLGGSVADLEGLRLHSLGMALIAKGSFEDGAATLAKAVEIRERVHGAQSREVAMSRNGLCFAASRRGDQTSALEECRRATDLWIELLGPTHPDVAFGLNNLCAVLSDTGHYREAVVQCGRVLDITRTSLGDEHPRTIVAANNLGDALSKAGDHTRAVALLEQAVSTREKLPDSAEPPLAFVLTSLGQALLRAGDSRRALATFERARTRFTPQTNADERAEVVFGMAAAQWNAGVRPRARALAAEAAALAPKGSDVARRIEAWLADRR